MNKDYRTIKIWLETYRMLRLVSALLGESLVELLHRLVQAEHDRISK